MTTLQGTEQSILVHGVSLVSQQAQDAQGTALSLELLHTS